MTDSPVRLFATAEFARTCRIRRPLAQTFLAHFESVGLVERRGTDWAVTARGVRLSRDLTLASRAEAEAA
jgi:hypothetical protein